MRWSRRPWTQACGCSAAGWPRTSIPSWWAGDRTITAGTYPQTKEVNGGFTVLDLPSREAVGRENRGRLPLCSRDPRVHARPGGGQLNEAQHGRFARPTARTEPIARARDAE